MPEATTMSIHAQSVPAVEEVVAPLRPARAGIAATVGIALGGLVLLREGFSAWHLTEAASVVLLAWLAAIDLESRLIPNRLVLPGAACVLAIAFVLDPERGLAHTLAALAAGAALLAAVLLRPAGLGMGDVKLGFFLGALLGGAVLSAVLLGFILVGVAGVVLVARRGRSALKAQLPLAPFLAAGAVVLLLVG